MQIRSIASTAARAWVCVPALALTLAFPTGLNAGEIRQLTDMKAVSFDWPMPDGDGGEIFVVTSSNQFAGGGNPDFNYQIVSFDPSTGTGTPITSFTSSLSHVRHNLSVSDDGQWLAFVADGDLIPGMNNNRSPEVFVIKRDGTGLDQLTDDSTAHPGNVSRVAMAGSGNRIAFAASSDLTGGNPQRTQQVFIIDRDGTNLTQVTQTTEGEIQHMWISDDGTRIAFSHNGDLTGGNPEKNHEIFTFAVGDTSPRQVTSTVAASSMAANVSGDGSTIVFHSTGDFTGNNSDGGLEIFAADWATATISQVTDSTGGIQNRESRQAWPTNDGQQLFFVSNQAPVFPLFFEVFKINTDGTGLTQLTSLNTELMHPVVSGDGSQFAVWADAGLHTATGTGTNELELITRVVHEQGYPDMSADGERLVFISGDDPLGTNPDHSVELFTIKTDGTELAQATSTPVDNFGRPAMAGDGTRIYFESLYDPLGTNADGNSEVFGMDIGGSNIVQYSDCVSNTNYSVYPEVSDDGNVVLFVSLCDLTGDNPDFTGELFRVDADGSNLTQVTDFPSVVGLLTYVYWPRVDATGTWVVVSGNANLDGGNPDNSFEVWRIKTDGTGLEQITDSPTADVASFHPDISADGTRIVFQSDADLTGQNPDNNSEIFFYEPGVTPVRQLTQTMGGARNNRVRISRDGEYAFFLSTEDLLGSHGNTGRSQLYRYHIDTDTLVRAGGLALEDALSNYWPSVDTDGTVVAYAPQGNASGVNPDDYWELVIADFGASNPPVVSPGPAPTTISFQPEPGSVRYDIIRGDVADLQDGGGSVNLGTVVCIEDNSGDTTTATAFDDPVTPAAGQAFFYLFRGSMGSLSGPGSYGTGNPGERLASGGDCGI